MQIFGTVAEPVPAPVAFAAVLAAMAALERLPLFAEVAGAV